MLIYIFIGIILFIVIYFLIQYNTFIKLNNMKEEAFSTMDVYLKKRWELIPKLIEIIKLYVKHENNILEKLVTLRQISYEQMNQIKKIDANEQLSKELSKIIAISENYPDLKASENFVNLLNQLSRIEDEIANSRKYYNAIVRKLNTKIQIFPSNIIAKIFKFETQKMFEISNSEEKNMKVEL